MAVIFLFMPFTGGSINDTVAVKYNLKAYAKKLCTVINIKEELNDNEVCE